MLGTAPISQIQQLLAARRYGEALALCQRFVLANPKSQQVYFFMGLCYFQLGDPEKSVAAHSKALSVGPQQPAILLNRGISLAFQKNFAPALEDFRAVLKSDQKSAVANNYAGMCLFELGRFEDALRYFDKALSLEPNSAQANYSKARTLQRLQKAKIALGFFQKAIQLDPRNPEIQNDLANCYRELQRNVEALSAYNASLSARPDHPGVLNNRGIVLREMGRFEEALESYNSAIRLNPNYAEAHNNKGVALVELRRFDAALASYDHALKLSPNYPEAHNNRGLALFEMQRFGEALESYDKAIELNPAYAEAHNNKGFSLFATGHLQQAFESFNRCIELDPNFAKAYNNRANALCQMLHFDEALNTYNNMLAQKPAMAEVSFGRSQLLLLRGDFKHGFQEYEHRWYNSEPLAKKLAQKPLWLGAEHLSGKTLFVHHEQGLGDTIQFARYLDLAAKLAHKIYFAPQPSLVQLFQGRFPCELVDLRTDKIPAFDFYAPLLSLPLACETRESTIPSHVPYLFAEDERVQQWSERIGGTGCKIGICWQGSRKHIDVGRSFPVSQFEPLSKIPGVRLISLHKGEGEGQLKSLPAGMKVETLGADFDAGADAFLDTAAVMKCCDLVISSDTAVAHLAGALGVSVWVALQHVPDWRWQLDRDDSPWYPTMRLFRQKSFGDWASAFREIENALMQRINS